MNDVFTNYGNAFIDAENRLSELLGIEVPIIKEEETRILRSLATLLIENGRWVYPSVWTKEGADADLVTLRAFLDTCTSFFDDKAVIDELFTPDVLDLDVDRLHAEWRNASLKFAIARAGSQNAVKNKLRIYARDPKKITGENIVELFRKISTYKTAVQKAVEISSITRASSP